MKEKESAKSEGMTGQESKQGLLQAKVDALSLRMDRYVCLNHIALLEEVAESNLKDLIEDVSHTDIKDVYDRLKKNKKDRAQLIQNLIIKVEQGKEISSDDEDQKELHKALGSIDQDMRHPYSLTDDERLRYSYYKQIEPLLIAESNSDALTKGRSQYLDKRGVRTFLWDLLRLHIQDFCRDINDDKTRRGLLLKYEATIMIQIVAHTQYVRAGVPYGTWEEKYIKDLTTLQGLLGDDFKGDNSPKYVERLDLLNQLFSREKKKRDKWGVRNQNQESHLKVDPEENPAADPKGLESDPDYRTAKEEIEKYIGRLDNASMDVTRASCAILIEHYEKKKDLAAKKFYENNKWRKIGDDYKKGLVKWKSPAALMMEHSEAIQGMLGARIGYAWSKGDASKLFNWKFGAELGVEIAGVFLATVPGGVFIKSLFSGLITGGFEKNSPNEVLEQIAALKRHIDKKFEIRNIEEKTNTELSKIRAEFDKLKILDDATFKDFVNDRLEYSTGARAKSNALENVRNFLEGLDTQVSTILVAAYGCGAEDFLSLKAPTSNVTAIGYKSKDKEVKDKEGQTLFNLLKSHHLEVPHQYTLLDLQNDVDHLVERLKDYLNLLLSSRNLLLPLITDLYAFEKNSWREKEKNERKDTYKNAIRQGLKFDTTPRKGFYQIITIQAQLDKTLSLLIGAQNSASIAAIGLGSSFELLPRYTDQYVLSANLEEKPDEFPFPLPFKWPWEKKKEYSWLVLMDSKRSSDGEKFKYDISNRTMLNGRFKYEHMLCTTDLSTGKRIRVLDKSHHANRHNSFHFSLEEDDGYFSILVVDEKDQYVLDVLDSKTEDYAKVVLGKKGGENNQQFAVQAFDPKLSQVKSFDGLLSAKTKCTAHFIPGDHIQSQMRYYGMKSDGSLGAHYLILNAVTNNLEIWWDHEGSTYWKEDRLVWSALAQPPGDQYIVEARFSRDGKLSIYQMSDPLISKEAHGEKPKEIWNTKTSGNPYTDLRLLDMGDQPLLVIATSNGWSIWRSDNNEYGFSDDLKVLIDGTAFLHNQVAFLSGKTHSFKHSPYMPSASSAPSDLDAAAIWDRVDVYLTIKKGQLYMTQLNHSTPGANSRFRFVMEDAHRSLFKIMSVKQGKYLELTGNQDSEEDLSKVKCKLELKPLSKDAKGQLFFVQSVPTVIEEYRSGLTNQKTEHQEISKAPKVIVRPLQLLNKSIPIDCRDAWYDESRTYERSIDYDGSQMPTEGSPFYIAFNMSRMASENFVDQLSDFMTSDMKAMCFNKDESEYALFSEVSYYIRRRGHPGAFRKGVYIDGDPMFPIWWGATSPYFPIKSAIYLADEKSYYLFYGRQRKYVKISVDDDKTEIGSANRWSVPVPDISSVCYDSKRRTLHFFYGGSWVGHCNSCHYRGEVYGMNPHKINEDWAGLPAIEYRAVVYAEHLDCFYFFHEDKQYKVSGEQVAGNVKSVEDDNW